ncbi:L,D-peptidoglycan transpeptidase YkuD (ErfK/YbiS/YcfS/YnhG family) [Micromonospora jinlongensis]|uniref:L,D-peptidoglycan transpeptidase YkuD (ErfK/YbiS/YcfS/YnhG family) n=1 Tax=Micromonospora jinlongensis TaxID=1287877 RepID=A0A7Y9WZN4_9ACTN|nr:L,D-transpeptidase family protein [Micromonospora jinlongensis]NYH42114.1 L,D-peptidoglycan transpeptidase YkuD (ErfK/YbiS/YcfS/YnhG family) [Micromonospora jinlongensis]
MKRRSLLLGTAVGLAAPAVLAPTAPALGATRPPPAWGTAPVPHSTRPTVPRRNLAARLTTLPAQTKQVIVVGSTSYTTTYATLEAYVKVRGRWQPASASLPARIGSKGFSDNHVEGVPTTPTGVYSIGPTMYGIAANPGVRYPYHRLVSGDWWNENPASAQYNSFQHTSTNPGGASEALWTEVPAYTHFAVITYNMVPNVAKPVPNAGSGIFLHQFSTSAGNATAGCVSLSHDNLVDVLSWLDPTLSPRIVLSPYAELGRY